MAIDVLVLDGEARPALAVVRSLGRKELSVAVASDDPLAIAGHSRYTTRFDQLPSPRKGNNSQEAGTEYIEGLVGLIEKISPRMLLPITDLSCKMVLKHRAKLPSSVHLPGVDESTFLAVSQKEKLLERARALGIQIPTSLSLTLQTSQDSEIANAIASFPYPAVLKPESSEQEVNGEFKKASVLYPNSASEVRTILEREENRELTFLLQQRVVGAGVGVFALCRGGRTLATFCHRRILEKPPSGGRSVLCESISESEAPVKEAKALLADLAWEGVAMVEFKQGTDGSFFLMEINPRFWGSLQLAIDSGRDFPYLLFLESHSSQTHSEFHTLPDYETGRRLRWDLGCLDHFLIRLKAEKSKALKDFLCHNALLLWNKPFRTSHETFQLTDPLPFVYELRSYARDFFA